MILTSEAVNQRWTRAKVLAAESKWSEAEALLGTIALALANDSSFLTLRGQVAQQQGDTRLAIDCFSQAVQLHPELAAHHFNLGEALAVCGQVQNAIVELRQAVELYRKPSAGWLLLARLLAEAGERAAALEELGLIAGAAHDEPEALKAVALHADQWGDRDLAETTLRRLLELSPTDLDAHVLRWKLVDEQVPPWHFPMMNDVARNQAYDRAIRRAVSANSSVLEIGTGAGLLAMMAARAGARRVTTCEMIPAIAETATEIVRRNGYADRISVIPKASTDLRVGVDLPEAADLLISEILSSDLVTENVVAAVDDARLRLMKPDARMIPRAVSAIVRLVGGEELARSASVGVVEGFDLSAFNRFAPGRIMVKFTDQAFVSLSSDVEVFRFDLDFGATPPREKICRLTVAASGLAVGLLQWIRIYLDEETIFENSPPERLDASGWKLALYPLSAPRQVMEGEVIRMRAGYSVGGLAFAEEH
jgi:tetratricopeptide (TPR) repeat protein